MRISGHGHVEPESHEDSETKATEHKEDAAESKPVRGGVATRPGWSHGGGGVDAKTIADLKQQYQDNGMTGTDIDRKDLPAAAQKQFDKDMKQWGPDYPPQAQKIEVDGKTFFGIEVDNDGGSFASFFDHSGKKVASGGASESGDWAWDK